MILTGYVPPTPSGETETRLRAALKDLDALLDVKWMPVVYWNNRQQAYEGRYALIVEWPKIDARWSMVQSGEVPPGDAFDIVGWLCEDMQDAQSVPTTTDGIELRVIELLGKMDNQRVPWKARFLSTIEKNRKRHLALKAEVGDETHDMAEYEYRRAKGVPQSTGADFTSTGALIHESE